jgi:hypothetical protein
MEGGRDMEGVVGHAPSINPNVIQTNQRNIKTIATSMLLKSVFIIASSLLRFNKKILVKMMHLH